jgi:cell division protein FtsI (penicillin-binding protein 3)
MLVLQPHADATTHGFTTGGYIAAPAVGRIIARIGPMLGVMPVAGDELAALDTALSVPLQPVAPPGVVALGPGRPLPPGANAFAYELMGENPPAGSFDRTQKGDARVAAKASARRARVAENVGGGFAEP